MSESNTNAAENTPAQELLLFMQQEVTQSLLTLFHLQLLGRFYS
jgi:hypothetical protein